MGLRLDVLHNQLVGTVRQRLEEYVLQSAVNLLTANNGVQATLYNARDLRCSPERNEPMGERETTCVPIRYEVLSY